MSARNRDSVFMQESDYLESTGDFGSDRHHFQSTGGCVQIFLCLLDTWLAYHFRKHSAAKTRSQPWSFQMRSGYPRTMRFLFDQLTNCHDKIQQFSMGCTGI